MHEISIVNYGKCAIFSYFLIPRLAYIRLWCLPSMNSDEKGFPQQQSIVVLHPTLTSFREFPLTQLQK